MSVYKPHKDRRKTLEEILKDLDPSTRELARAVLENMLREEQVENDYERILEKLRKQFQKRQE